MQRNKQARVGADIMPENRILEELFLREKPARILLGLKTTKDSIYATVLSKNSDCTYSHTVKILNLFKDLGIVSFEKSGRIKRVFLTNDGWDIAHNLEAMIKKFDQIEAVLKESGKKVERKKATTKTAK
jgi:predicted transcriptional regulator